MDTPTSKTWLVDQERLLSRGSLFFFGRASAASTIKRRAMMAHANQSPNLANGVSRAARYTGTSTVRQVLSKYGIRALISPHGPTTAESPPFVERTNPSILDCTEPGRLEMLDLRRPRIRPRIIGDVDQHIGPPGYESAADPGKGILETDGCSEAHLPAARKRHAEDRVSIAHRPRVPDSHDVAEEFLHPAHLEEGDAFRERHGMHLSIGIDDIPFL
jgi:hypothetical protein